MTRIVFAFLILAFVSVKGQCNSSTPPATTAELTSAYNENIIGGGTMTVTISKYSKLDSREVKTNYISYQVDEDRTLDTKFGLKYETDEAAAPLQIKIYTKISDGQAYSVDVTGSFKILRVNGRTPYTKLFQQIFTNDYPESDFHSLLGRNILMDVSRGYYDQPNDQLKIDVPWQF